ncbi:Hypothetical protein CAP_8411 [Chondromyces apiculatus DSM 436]|uniref:Uncharacterized protein n=1 Tax=Chondromyces apiculatus DSM 436 TaxID=1192034 RepID=A0A017SWM4_9BACT|nr:Hypothetical protein CAP_8411 [Chondromyces apiculatus DSM 436]
MLCRPAAKEHGHPELARTSQHAAEGSASSQGEARKPRGWRAAKLKRRPAWAALARVGRG